MKACILCGGPTDASSDFCQGCISVRLLQKIDKRAYASLLRYRVRRRKMKIISSEEQCKDIVET